MSRALSVIRRYCSSLIRGLCLAFFQLVKAAAELLFCSGKIRAGSLQFRLGSLPVADVAEHDHDCRPAAVPGSGCEHFDINRSPVNADELLFYRGNRCGWYLVQFLHPLADFRAIFGMHKVDHGPASQLIR